VTDGSGPFGHGYVRYRGVLKVSINTSDIKNSSGAVTQPAGRLKLLNTLKMNEYLYGVVPRETPASWPHEALVAQALTARSYAYNSGSELYCTTASQVYNGHSKGDRTAPQMHEDPRSNAAVNETSGKYVTYNGAVITTYFCSSSGGHTANIEDVWLSTGEPSTTHPYRRGVPSPYEGDQRWGPIQRDGLWLGAAIKRSYPGVCPPGAGSSVWVSKVVADRAASGHVRRLDVYWSNGHVSRGFAGTSFRSAVNAYAGSEVVKSTVFYFYGFPITRISGPTRYDTAVQVSREAFSSEATAVVLASGEDFADALSGSALAGALDGALLLTGRDALPESVRLELTRLRPSRIYVLGGTKAVSDAVYAAVRAALPSAEATRLAGADRYQTARKVAEEVARVAEPGAALVVSGLSWPDAAAASALAYKKGYPILLTPPTGLGSEAHTFLAARKTPLVLIAGGAKAVASVADAQVKTVTGGDVKRFSGADRYDTARLIAQWAVTEAGFIPRDVYLATGAAYPDALTGGVGAGRSASPLLLTAKDACPAGTAAFLRAYRDPIAQLMVLGGTAAVSEKGMSALDSTMMN
jgi:putative cell wall-binding protein